MCVKVFSRMRVSVCVCVCVYKSLYHVRQLFLFFQQRVTVWLYHFQIGGS